MQAGTASTHLELKFSDLRHCKVASFQQVNARIFIKRKSSEPKPPDSSKRHHLESCCPFQAVLSAQPPFLWPAVLFATGRSPNSANLGLESLGIELDRSGAIPVNAYSQTAVPSIHAIGDVTNRVNLTPVAIREGVAFTETVFKNNPTPVDHDLIPSAVFTQPELGTVGLTEEAARAVEEIEVYATTFKPMRTAFAKAGDKVLLKLIVSKATRVVLGCHIVAPAAGELIQMVGIAVKAGLTKEEFDRTIAVHPTMSEELVTMREPTR